MSRFKCSLLGVLRYFYLSCTKQALLQADSIVFLSLCQKNVGAPFGRQPLDNPTARSAAELAHSHFLHVTLQSNLSYHNGCFGVIRTHAGLRTVLWCKPFRVALRMYLMWTLERYFQMYLFLKCRYCKTWQFWTSVLVHLICLFCCVARCDGQKSVCRVWPLLISVYSLQLEHLHV